MCTAATYQTNDFYFGRTLDYESSYGEEIVIVPRQFRLSFLHMGVSAQHYAMIGTAHVAQGYPLFYDAVNEKGLCMAGLNFVGNACYASRPADHSDNVAQYELIPWILSQCSSTAEAKKKVETLCLLGTPFHEKMPAAQLHWLIADKHQAITVEATAAGIQVYDNPAGVLTNNPPFPEQMFRLNDFLHLSPKQPQNNFSDKLPLQTYSRGMGALGLPGDLSSQSRFVRAAFVRANAVSGSSEAESVSQFFHILGAVDQPRGCCEVKNGQYEITIYTSCCNADIPCRPENRSVTKTERTTSMSNVTKRALEQSLKNLLLKKPLTKITIGDITEDCGINRMTFYYHFKDIYDLVEWACLEDARRALDEKKTYDTWQQGLLQIFEAVQENKPFILNVYRCVHREQVEKYLQPLVDQLLLDVIDEEAAGMTLRDEDKQFIAKVYAYIFIGVMLDWIKNDMRENPQEIVSRLGKLLQGSVTAAISRFRL